MPIKPAKWWRRRPALAILSVVVSLAVVVGVIFAVVTLANRPALSCGSGLTANAASTACVGIDLDSERITPDQPDGLGHLLDTIKAHNAAVTGSNYVSVVLLLDLSPVHNLDTISSDVMNQGIEGAITAAWRANYDGAFSGADTGAVQSAATPVQPKVKLFLANMGSLNADWEKAVDRIGGAAAAQRITSVVGLGQSTDYTRRAATKLTTQYKLPVIGATVTGDNMNFSLDKDPVRRLDGFFRVSPTNSDTVVAAARYITQGLKIALSDVAIVEDKVTSDDYVTSLVKAAQADMPGAHEFTFASPKISMTSAELKEWLSGQFGNLGPSLCAAPRKVIYFAGRGADIPAFVQTWKASSSGCAEQPLLLLTGDDGSEAAGDDDLARALADPGVKVEFTGLTSPGQRGGCATAGRAAFDQFRAAFTGKKSCTVPAPAGAKDVPALPAFPDADLDNGQAMLTYDATGLAVRTARRAGPIALAQPDSQFSMLAETRCSLKFEGASGTVQFVHDADYYGNPIGSVLPILRITADKRAETLAGPGWPTTLPKVTPSPTDRC